MTNEEAIDELEISVKETKEFVEFIEGFQGYTNWLNSAKKRIELCNHAIKALEKQIPKKPRVNKKAGSAKCGCGATFDIFECTKFDSVKYCPYCGQAIDWSVT